MSVSRNTRGIHTSRALYRARDVYVRVSSLLPSAFAQTPSKTTSSTLSVQKLQSRLLFSATSLATKKKKSTPNSPFPSLSPVCCCPKARGGQCHILEKSQD